MSPSLWCAACLPIPVTSPLSLPRIVASAKAFARAPGLSLALLLTISLGVGSNAAVYGFLQGLTHPASPLKDSGPIVSIFRHDRSRQTGPLSPDDCRLLENLHGLFDWIGEAQIKPQDTVIGGNTEISTVAIVTPNLADHLAMPLHNGAVISHRVWEVEMNANTKAIGSHILVDGVDLRIDGIAPSQFDGLYSNQAVDLWIRSTAENLQDSDRGTRDRWALAPLRRNVSILQAQEALRSGPHNIRELTIAPFSGVAPGMARGLTRVGLFLSFAAGAVLFIACINVASLLLARALRRRHETSLLVALGATRAELLRQLFADSVVISIAGGALGLFVGALTARVLPALLFEKDAELLSFAHPMLPLLTASLLCVLITAACGMMPVFGTVTDRPWLVLQRETGSPSKGIRRLRSALVAGQIAACCVLVICTALLLASFHSALETSAGHRLGDPVLLTVQAPTGPDGPEVDPSYFTHVEQKAESLPGLSPLAWTARLPGNQPTWRTLRIQPPSQPYRQVVMDMGWLTPASFQILDRQPVAGRMFGLNDQGRSVAVVNEEAAAQIFGPQSAGVVIRDAANRPIEIIGVVKPKSADAGGRNRPAIYYGFSAQSPAPPTIRDARFRVPLTPPAAGIELSANVVSASYFRAFSMPLITGRLFPHHRVTGQPRVAVVNQEAADLYFNGKPIGAGVIDESDVRTEIIGVVGSQVFGTFQQHPEPAIYFPMGQDLPPRMTLVLHAAQWSNSMAAGLKSRMETVPGGSAASIGVNTLHQQLAQSGLAPLRIATLIGGASAAISLLLSILGLLSALGDAERQRQRERALRIALGAQRWRIVFMVVKDAGSLAFVGAAAGTFLSFALSRLLIAKIPAVTSPPSQVWLVAALLPVAVALVASIVPARRASAISPLSIMRDL